ncbi:MAG: response regulator [Bacteroidota bacterium]
MKMIRMDKKVLIVDDEENILISLSYLLKKEGYTVKTASNGKEALESFKQFKPEIVLLDVMMPEKDGFSTASDIRQIDKKSETHIIFLTAKGTSQDKLQGYISGADDYVVKPFDNEVLLDKIMERLT